MHPHIEKDEVKLFSRTDDFVGKAEPSFTPQQQFAATLAYCTAGFCVVALTAIFIYRIWDAPHLPPPTDTQKIEEYLRNVRELDELANRNARDLFEMTVSITALPLLTTLVGFLIGRASKHSD